MSRYRRLLIGLALLAASAFAASLLAGPTAAGSRLLSGWLGRGSAVEIEAARIIIAEIRLPRALLGFLIGGALGISGAALQGYLRNPLAEPGLIGASAGGALGAVLAIHLGLSAAFALALPLMGLVGAFAAVSVVLMLSGARAGPLTLILGGVAVTSLAGALTSLVLNLSDNPFAATEILFWMLGSLTDRSMTHVALAGPLVLLGTVCLLLAGRALDALSLGEDGAASLGIDLVRLRRLVVAGTALAIGASTAVAGSISFVGLIVPHLLRSAVGQRPGRLLPASFLGGASLLLFADIAVRLADPVDLRLGVLTALIGAPFFLWLVFKTRRELAP
ncbi:MAG: iron ABC transporter permease [Hyphomicrobiaceae bacterium]|nr:MAG: iron ABC transporter permease [Hyphomicrobiaceae bacterium]